MLMRGIRKGMLLSLFHDFPCSIIPDVLSIPIHAAPTGLPSHRTLQLETYRADGPMPSLFTDDSYPTSRCFSLRPTHFAYWRMDAFIIVPEGLNVCRMAYVISSEPCKGDMLAAIVLKGSRFISKNVRFSGQSKNRDSSHDQ
jgi:hypothetical protein